MVFETDEAEGQIGTDIVNKCGVHTFDTQSTIHTSTLGACTYENLSNYSANWPREIRCEMNVQKWESSLKEKAFLKSTKM